MENMNEELLKKLEELTKKEDFQNIYKEISEIRKKWHFAKDEASYYEQELQDKFDEYMNVIYAKLKENAIDAKNIKEGIISKAKVLLDSDNFKKNSETMKKLFDEWKLAGKTDKETDDALWEEFNNIKNEFYNKKQAYFDNLKQSFLDNEQIKLSLIEEATKANELTDIKELTNKMNDLMNKWKATKSASREKDEELWEKFNAQRKIFFTKKNDYFEQMKAVFAQRAEEKKEIIAKAKHCLAMSEFSDEEVNTINELRTKWKEIGSAGREFENDLWQQFSTIINKYLDNMKYYR